MRYCRCDRLRGSDPTSDNSRNPRAPHDTQYVADTCEVQNFSVYVHNALASSTACQPRRVLASCCLGARRLFLCVPRFGSAPVANCWCHPVDLCQTCGCQLLLHCQVELSVQHGHCVRACQMSVVVLPLLPQAALAATPAPGASACSLHMVIPHQSLQWPVAIP